MTRTATRLVRESNPITNQDGTRWQRSADASVAFDNLVNRIAEDRIVSELELSGSSRPRAMRLAIAIGAVVLVLGFVVRAAPSEDANLAGNSLAPLSEDYLWASRPGTVQSDAAAAFVQEVLGRTDRHVGRNPRRLGPTWFESRRDGADLIEFLLVPREEGWMVLQVGEPPVVRKAGGRGMAVLLDDVAGAESATIFFFARETNQRAEASVTDMRTREVILAGIDGVDSVLVLYRDQAGLVIDADGGVFGSPRDGTPPPEPADS